MRADYMGKVEIFLSSYPYPYEYKNIFLYALIFIDVFHSIV